MTLSFRLAKASQLSEIRSLYLKSMAYIAERMGFEQPGTAFSNLGEILKNRNLYVLQSEDRVLGAAALHETSNSLYIDYLAVRSDHQQKGLGKQMLADLEVLAESRELPQLQLHTPEVMDELIAFYGRRGFSETHRVLPEHGRDQVLRVHFSKPIEHHDTKADHEFEHDRLPG